MLKAEQPQTLMALLKNTFLLWRSSYLLIFSLTLIAVIIGSAPHFFIPALNTYNIPAIEIYLRQNFFWFLVYSIIALFFFTVILFRLYQAYIGEPGSILAALKICLLRFPKVYLAMLTYTLIVMLAYLFFIIPGVYFMITLFFMVPLIVLENYAYPAAFKACFELIDGLWWRTFAFFASVTVVIHIILLIVESLTKSLWVVNTDQGNIWLSAHLFRLFLNSLFYPFVLCQIIVYLNDLKLRRNVIASPRTTPITT